MLARLGAQADSAAPTVDDDEAEAQPLAVQLAIDVNDGEATDAPAPDAVAP